jgi:formylmethanofuran dehydrogenase subunit D
MSNKDWNWNNEDEKLSTVVPSVDAVAVYENSHGNVVIRQQNQMGDEDSVIIIPRSSVPAIVKALNQFKGKTFKPVFKDPAL